LRASLRMRVVGGYVWEMREYSPHPERSCAAA
jgi:hypothetical protein